MEAISLNMVRVKWNDFMPLIFIGSKARLHCGEFDVAYGHESIGSRTCRWLVAEEGS